VTRGISIGITLVDQMIPKEQCMNITVFSPFVKNISIAKQQDFKSKRICLNYLNVDFRAPSQVIPPTDKLNHTGTVLEITISLNIPEL
jgi:hypothetical protein